MKEYIIVPWKTACTRIGVVRGSRRDITIAIGLIVATIVLGTVSYALVAPGLIDAAFDGTAEWSWLNETVDRRRAIDPDQRDRAYFHWVGRTTATRLALTWSGLVLLWLLWQRRVAVRARLTGYFNEQSGPLTLAVTRVAVFYTLFRFADRLGLPHFSSLPAELQFPPTGLGPVLALLPASPEIAGVLLPVFKVVCLAAMVGFCTRFSAVIATLLALYVLGIPQMFGKVNHCHHLIWFGAILAASPCGDALSVDALLRRWRGRSIPRCASRRYALPMRFIWILFGLLYFFPGFWKIWMGGVDWIFSDHLRNQMYHLWSTHETWRPVIDPSGSRAMTAAGGIATIVFEMGMILLIFTRRTRLVAMVVGLSFHVATALTLNILFAGLLWSYVAWIDWDLVAARLRRRPMPEPEKGGERSSLVAVSLVGSLMVGANALMGVTGNVNGWPFACYPRFSYPIFRPERAVIEFDLVEPDGTVVAGDLESVRGRFRTARWVGLVRSILADGDEERQVARLRALCMLALDDPDRYAAIRFVRATYSTLPADRGQPPIARVLLRQVDLGPEAASR